MVIIMIDTKIIEESIRNIILALGDDPEREGLVKTPERVANMYAEIFEGMNYTNEEIADKYKTCFKFAGGTEDIVLVQDIPIFSYCEHHIALMYNMKVSIAYIPANKIIGLSKIYRIAKMVGRRLQLQEKIGLDIVDIMKRIVETEDIIVTISAEHSCITTRGANMQGGVTKTITASGKFKDSDKKNEILKMMNLI